MNISDEAVEAGARVLKPSAWDERVNWGSEDSRRIHQDYYRTISRTVLAAAAPHLLAPLLALADERDETHGAIRGHITTYELRQAIDPYRSHS